MNGLGLNRPRPDNEDTSSAVAAFLGEARRGLSLPFPGHGRTAERLRALRDQSANDASVGRLFEAHTDAIAILFEAGVQPPSFTALAVWASGPTTSTFLDKKGDSFVLNGKRSFCGGASIVDAALVTADSPQGERLVLVDLRRSGVFVDSASWKSEAFRDAGIATVQFSDARVAPGALIGPPGWYGTRPGFWYGAVGVAAMWAGITDSLLARLPLLLRHRDQISGAATGAIQASMWAVAALLDQAGAQIDGLPDTRSAQSGKAIALACRHTVRSHLESAILAFDQEVGPAAIAFDSDLGRTRSELTMSMAQTHGPRDLVILAET